MYMFTDIALANQTFSLHQQVLLPVADELIETGPDQAVKRLAGCEEGHTYCQSP
jgi:acetone carboxylase gamma subunit